MILVNFFGIVVCDEPFEPDERDTIYLDDEDWVFRINKRRNTWKILASMRPDKKRSQRLGRLLRIGRYLYHKVGGKILCFSRWLLHYVKS